jgi:uroporphyrinogen decarboxylase
MNKREIILSLIDADIKTPYLPAAFFLHFDKQFHHGQRAIDKHLDYYKYTGMDIVKIQYELTYPKQPDLQSPADWSKIPLMGEAFYQDQWQIVKGLVEKTGKEALILMTLYSPFMLAGQVVGRDILENHIKENPEKVKIGMEIITESLLIFVRGCIAQGIDGFYHSTQGGEANHFGGSHLFGEYIKPYDLAVMNEINENSIFNILHICDYHDGYDDLTPYLDYPGDVVNCSLKLGSHTLTGKIISQMFDRPFMGGFDRKGIIVNGNQQDIQNATDEIVENGPDNIILGADCTLPSNIQWDRIKNAIAYSHSLKRD